MLRSVDGGTNEHPTNSAVLSNWQNEAVDSRQRRILMCSDQYQCAVFVSDSFLSLVTVRWLVM